jgi:hypothetical protein
MLCRRTKRSLQIGYQPGDKDFASHRLDERVFLFMGGLNWFEWLLLTFDGWGSRIGVMGNFSLFAGGIIFQLLPLCAMVFNQSMDMNKNIIISIILCVAILWFPAEWLVQKKLCKKYQNVTPLIPKRIWRNLNIIVISILLESYTVGAWLQYIAYKSGLFILAHTFVSSTPPQSVTIGPG